MPEKCQLNLQNHKPIRGQSQFHKLADTKILILTVLCMFTLKKKGVGEFNFFLAFWLLIDY